MSVIFTSLQSILQSIFQWVENHATLLTLGFMFLSFLAEHKFRIFSRIFNYIISNVWPFKDIRIIALIKKYQNKIYLEYSKNFVNAEIPFKSALKKLMTDYIPLNIDREGSNIYTPIELLQFSKKTVLLGSPGSGKSTYLINILVEFTKGNLDIVDTRSESDNSPNLTSYWTSVNTTLKLVPIYIDLKQMYKEMTNNSSMQLIDYIEKIVSDYIGKSAIFFINNLCKQKRMLFLFDGLDEIFYKNRNKFKISLFSFYRNDINNDVRFIITCRSAIYRNEMRGITDAQLLLKDLEEPEIEAYLTNFKLLDVQSARDLISTIKDKERLKINKIVRSPLMLSMIAYLYANDYKKDLPRTRASLYRDCTNALISEWKKERLGNLADQNTINIKKSFRALAFFAHKNMIWGEGDKEEFEMGETDVLREISTAIVSSSEVINLLNMMVEDVGLLHRDKSLEKYKFVHNTFREYFVASHFVENNLLEDLINLFRNDEDKWREPLLLACSLMNPTGLNSTSHFMSVIDEIKTINKIFAYECIVESDVIISNDLLKIILSDINYIILCPSSLLEDKKIAFKQLLSLCINSRYRNKVKSLTLELIKNQCLINNDIRRYSLIENRPEHVIPFLLDEIIDVNTFKIFYNLISEYDNCTGIIIKQIKEINKTSQDNEFKIVAMFSLIFHLEMRHEASINNEIESKENKSYLIEIMELIEFDNDLINICATFILSLLSSKSKLRKYFDVEKYRDIYTSYKADWLWKPFSLDTKYNISAFMNHLGHNIRNIIDKKNGYIELLSTFRHLINPSQHFIDAKLITPALLYLMIESSSQSNEIDRLLEEDSWIDSNMNMAWEFHKTLQYKWISNYNTWSESINHMQTHVNEKCAEEKHMMDLFTHKYQLVEGIANFIPHANIIYIILLNHFHKKSSYKRFWVNIRKRNWKNLLPSWTARPLSNVVYLFLISATLISIYLDYGRQDFLQRGGGGILIIYIILNTICYFEGNVGKPWIARFCPFASLSGGDEPVFYIVAIIEMLPVLFMGIITGLLLTSQLSHPLTIIILALLFLYITSAIFVKLTNVKNRSFFYNINSN
ncbi:MAG: NACHT domain-containing protein [Defluviitaleaceae bacterium]|nr:NACHT domain-containing protein [Defluviitaleaceae bacterium]MCL2239873.1 NACHT domain-containing protein [Defluviitaleaceae bacterium]